MRNSGDIWGVCFSILLASVVRVRRSSELDELEVGSLACILNRMFCAWETRPLLVSQVNEPRVRCIQGVFTCTFLLLYLGNFLPVG